LLHRHGYLKLASWSGGSFTGNAQEESQKINEERAKVDADIDVESIEKFTDKLPHLFHIILESDDSSPDIEQCNMQFRYTEKTLKVLFLGYPFILYGNYGTLKLLQTHGFKTFHPHINETYDLIPSRHLRVQALIIEIDRLSRMSDTDFEALMGTLVKVTEYNKAWLKSRKMKDNLREQGEYALGLKNQRVFDYTELFSEMEKALATVNAPKCDYIANIITCDTPTCDKDVPQTDDGETEDVLESTAKTTIDSEKKDIESGHKLVFENDKGEVVVIGNQVIKSDTESEANGEEAEDDEKNGSDKEDSRSSSLEEGVDKEGTQ
jgi:hypothetical protein